MYSFFQPSGIYDSNIACRTNWNSLPDNVIIANSIGVFENRLDRFWSNQACYYDYKADLTGTGSQRLKAN